MAEYDPEKARASALKRYYGITLEQYDELLQRQNGCCAVCERPAAEFKVNLSVDHDHHSGEIRGLLCNMCNHRRVGRYRRNDIGLLTRLVAYLEQGTGWFVPDEYKTKRRRRATRKPQKVNNG